MTLLVGILAQDGVVISSDGVGTLMDGKTPMMQMPARKMSVIDGTILATAGPVGLSQRLNALIAAISKTEMWADRGSPLNLPTSISSNMVADMERTKASRGTFGALFGFRTPAGFQLCELEMAELQPEMRDANNWFSVLGSGLSIASPLLALLGQTLFRDSPPSLEEAVATAYWVLRTTIRFSPPGIGFPIHMATLSSGEQPGSTVARLLEKAEIEQQEEDASRLDSHLARWRLLRRS